MTDAANGPAAAPALERTVLAPFHRAHGAHLVPFAGWEMPLYYSSILVEHRAVRASVGAFDVSHMGILAVRGPSAAALLSRRTTADVGRLGPGQAKYAFALESTGRIIDDLLVSRLHGDDAGATPSYLVVPNAARTAEITEILAQHRRPDTTIERCNGRVAIVAVQGPDSRAVLERVFGWSLGSLKFYHARFFPLAPTSPTSRDGAIGRPFPDALADDVLVSRTGYTGELGYELFVAGNAAVAVAERLATADVVPAGLGARDTLRLEKGYLLSGQEFHRDRTPIEAGQERFVDWDHAFYGRDVLVRQRDDPATDRLVGVRLDEAGAVPRHGTPIRVGDGFAGALTSGGISPTLGVGIGLAYVPRALAVPGTPLTAEIRGRPVPGVVAPLPFVPARPAPPRPSA